MTHIRVHILSLTRIYRNSSLITLVCIGCLSSWRFWQPGAFSQFIAPAFLTCTWSIIVRAAVSMSAFVSNSTTCCFLLTSCFCICKHRELFTAFRASTKIRYIMCIPSTWWWPRGLLPALIGLQISSFHNCFSLNNCLFVFLHVVDWDAHWNGFKSAVWDRVNSIWVAKCTHELEMFPCVRVGDGSSHAIYHQVVNFVSS